MEPTAAAIEKIVRAIVDEVRPIRVILFGSIARGESRASSDVDLLVIVPLGGGTGALCRLIPEPLR